ncbi:MAG: hypothetical protein DI534_06325 [Leifsonia xyli]|nr:MAG: hypothetical protein DI534_06325 [Leifsonia xyli]
MSTATPPPDDARPRAPFQAERVGAFVDAVVAIAMTLLILPLMESVSDVASAGDDTLRWLGAHEQQFLSFLVSFVIIAMFWMIHHRLFVGVHAVTTTLMWMLVGWLLTIVWLPVATAISGAMPGDDKLAKVVYIGSMIATSLFSLAIRLYLRRNTWLHEHPPSYLLAGIAADITTATLFGVALALSLVIPGIGYYSMFVMLLGPFAQRLTRRMLAAA